MDAEARAELDGLRLRAYGPAPDIAGDQMALGRLIALEELALPAPDAQTPGGDEPPVRSDRVVTGTDRRPSGATVIGGAPQAARVVGVRPRAGAGSDRRTWWHGALVAAVAVLAVPLGLTAAQQPLITSAPPVTESPRSVLSALDFTENPDAEVLMTVRIDGSFGGFVDMPSAGEVPLFPVEGLMTWVQPLGDYYGWKLWIGGARGAIEDENCLLLDGAGTMRASCVTSDLQAQGALLVSVPFADIQPQERPAGMTAAQSLGFWLRADGTMRILLAPTPAD